MKIPGEAVVTGHLLVVEYMEPDGSFHFRSECFGTGQEPLALGKTLELVEYAKAQSLAPMLADAVSEFLSYEEELSLCDCECDCEGGECECDDDE